MHFFARFAILLIVAVAGIVRPAHSQNTAPAYLTVFEPIEWAQEGGRVAVRAGVLLRVRGLAFHPQGIRSITIAGEPATREADPSGATSFTGYVTVTAGLQSVEIVLQPESGTALRQRFALIVEGADPTGAAAAATASPVRPRPRYSPTSAFVGGLVLPGFGQFYTGRPTRGLLHLLGAGGAVAGSFVASSPGRKECNEFNECREVEARSDLTPIGLAVAGVITLWGAVDGLSFARRSVPAAEPQQRGELERAAPGSVRLGLGDARLEGPAFSASRSGVSIELLRIVH